MYIREIKLLRELPIEQCANPNATKNPAVCYQPPTPRGAVSHRLSTAAQKC
jgi:hypothetical protein